MEIITAKYAGFCFGVERAVKTVQNMIGNRKENAKIYTLGKLIHNPRIIEELAQSDVSVITEDEIETAAAKACEEQPFTVVIRTHGITKTVNEKLLSLSRANPFFSVIDCTCPFVKKIQKIASDETNDNTVFVILGDKTHPEVRGIISYASGAVNIVNNFEELLLCNLNDKNVIITAQTTQNLSEWEKCQKYIKKHCTNAKIFDTICSVTENRQNEAAKLASSVDLMLVVGGKESSNTNKLLAIASRYCSRSYMIEDASELPPIDCSVTKVGITAGASTPGSIIEEVIKSMSEIEKNETVEEGGENFAQMFDESFKTLNTGDIVKGVITSVSANELHVDLSSKVTGIVPFDEITDDSSVNLADLYKVGDEIEAQAVRVSDLDGVATLSVKRIARLQGWRKIVEVEKTGEILEGKVTEIVKGGIIVTYNHTKVFIPERQSGVPKDGNLNALKWQSVRFRIIEVNEERNRAVGSIRSVEREERKAKLEDFWTNIEEGKKYTGVVKSLTSYGAFVDLGGIDGMVHVSELSWNKIKNPAEVVSVGDTVDVFVKSFDREKKRISLGYKTPESDPFVIFTNTYKKGDVATVKIVNLTPFGAFAEIIPGIDGLIHISQIANKKIAHPSNELKIGQEVDAKITEIDTENRKISLSMRALLNPESEVTEESAE